MEQASGAFLLNLPTMVLYNPTTKEMLTTHWGKEACEVYFRSGSEAERIFGEYVTGYFDYLAEDFAVILATPEAFDFNSVLKFAMNASAAHGLSHEGFTQISFRAQDVRVLKSGV